jgi:hypothetical protein
MNAAHGPARQAGPQPDDARDDEEMNMSANARISAAC